MKICMVNSFYPPWVGGAETYVSTLAQLLARRGHDVTVYCAHDPLPVGESIEKGVRVRRMRAPFRLYGTPMVVSPLNLFLEDYDIIHCNFPSPYLSALFAFFSRFRGIPAVLTWHNDLPPVTSAAGLLVRAHDLFAPVYLNQYKRIIATTEVYARESPILARYRERLVVISNGVDTDRFNPSVDGEPVRRRYGLSGKKVVLFVGALTRWHAYKGLGTLLRAFKPLRQTLDSHLLVVGGGPLVDEYRKIVGDLGLASDVTFTGRVPEESLPAYYAACDLFVLPSLDRSEGFGLVLLEAMATGKPVVASRVGGMIEVVNDRETGLLVDPNDPQALATAIAAILRDDDQARRMGSAGRRFAEARDWKRVTLRVEALYGEVIRTSAHVR